MVKIKGVNGNLMMVFDPGPFPDVFRELGDTVKANPQLFKGSRVIFSGAGLADFSLDEIAALQQLVSTTAWYKTILTAVVSRRELHPVGSLRLCPRFPRVFIHRNLRSGQKVHSEGAW
jgi:septum site-determining protein MinC